MRRSGPLRRRTPLRAKKQINPVSRKRRSEKAEYEKLRAKLVLHPSAACRICARHPQDLHHRRQMGDGGAYTNPKNVMGLCRSCHEWIHENSARGAVPHQRGWLVMEGDDEYEALGERAWRNR